MTRIDRDYMFAVMSVERRYLEVFLDLFENVDNPDMLEVQDSRYQILEALEDTPLYSKVLNLQTATDHLIAEYIHCNAEDKDL